MANEFRASIETKEFDAENSLIRADRDELVIQQYEANSSGSFTLINNSSYIVIPFAQVTEANIIVINSNNKIDFKFNAGQEVFNIEFLFLKGAFTSLQLRNNNSTSVEISYDFYGKG